jgi:hypothetical protein
MKNVGGMGIREMCPTTQATHGYGLYVQKRKRIMRAHEEAAAAIAEAATEQ